MSAWVDRVVGFSCGALGVVMMGAVVYRMWRHRQGWW